MPIQLLPQDSPVVMEQALCARIRDTFLAVSLIAQYVNVSARERYPDNEDDDIAITTKPDPATPDIPFTSIIQVGIPEIREKNYSNEQLTQLDFIYPISFDMDVRDNWANQDFTLTYTDSRSLFMAVYMLGRQAFKLNPDGSSNRDLGFTNCVHDYLQQESAVTVADEETGKLLHTANWSLTIHITGVQV
jgi:hypothetical protein